MVSIHRPLGYGPSALPLRHPAVLTLQSSMFYMYKQYLKLFEGNVKFNFDELNYCLNYGYIFLNKNLNYE